MKVLKMLGIGGTYLKMTKAIFKTIAYIIEPNREHFL